VTYLRATADSDGSQDQSPRALHYRPAGYVQGMADLLAPILAVMDEEVDSFWCFVGFMERMVRLHAMR